MFVKPWEVAFDKEDQDIERKPHPWTKTAFSMIAMKNLAGNQHVSSPVPSLPEGVFSHTDA